MEPASIRYKNPGAMWGNALARKWGAAAKAVTLNDGKGQGNNIAVFPTFVRGICAQLDLWRSSSNYKNKKFKDAIAIWSGHNSVQSYINFVSSRVPGMTPDTVMNDTFWRSDKGIAFLKAQAWHEAGKQYPAPAEDWINAQAIVLGQKPLEPAKKVTQTIIVTGASQVAAESAGFSTGSAVLLGAIVTLVVVGFLVWKHFRDAKAEREAAVKAAEAVTAIPSGTVGGDAPKPEATSG